MLSVVNQMWLSAESESQTFVGAGVPAGAAQHSRRQIGTKTDRKAGIVLSFTFFYGTIYYDIIGDALPK